MKRKNTDAVAAIGAPAAAKRGLALVMLLSSAACDPFHVTFEDVESARTYRAADVDAPADWTGSLLVMTYNIKFGGARIDFFFDCHGQRVLMNKHEVLANLSALAEKINRVDPDLVVLQEVDVNSKRAAYVDQMQWLLDHTTLNYGVYASQWKADYVPSDGIGAVDSGNAILAKYPLVEAERLALSLRTDQSALTRYFYLRRNILRARLDLPIEPPVYVVAIHAEAYSKDGTKKQHIDRFKQELDALAREGALVIGAGDLNALPPGTLKTSEFPDSVCRDEDFIADDYREETDWLAALYESYAPAIPLEDYQADNAPFFTHTTDKHGFWNRKLDYIFTNASVSPGSGVVHQGESQGEVAMMPLSDHAPVTVTIELP